MLERLQKIIARAGIASRRHAEELIRSGQVLVNGVVVTELGAKADPEVDKVEAAGRTAEQPSAAGYYILNKPPHVVATMSDPEGRATLRHVLRGLGGAVFPVGRLDYAASGLILLTTDGKLADSIFKSSSQLPKVYWFKVKGRPTQETISKVSHKAQARLRLLRTPDSVEGKADNLWYEAEMKAVRRDLLRQGFFEAGHPVEKIKRVRLGPLELGDLPEGEYRQLAPSEVEALRRAVEKAAEQHSALPAPATPAPVGLRAFERKKWRPSGDRDRVPTQPMRPDGGGSRDQGFRPGPKRPPFQPRGERPDRAGGDRFRPAAKGGFRTPGPRTGPRPGPPRDFVPSGEERPPRSFRPGGEKKFPPRGERSGGSGFGRGGRPGDRGPSGPPRRFGPGGEKRFPPRGDRGGAGGFSRGGDKKFPPRGGERGGGGGFGRDNRTGDRGRSGPPRSFGPGVEKKFPPRGERGENHGAGAGAWRGDRPSGPPRGDRPSGPPRRSGPGKFAPRGARPGAGKFSGGRPSGKPPGRSGGRPAGRPSGRPGGRPNRPPR